MPKILKAKETSVPIVSEFFLYDSTLEGTLQDPTQYQCLPFVALYDAEKVWASD